MSVSHQIIRRAWERNRERALPTNCTAWRRLRASVLSDEPLCRHCKRKGLVTAANEVDHVDGNDSNNERSNLQALCKSCHSVKTVRDAGYRPKLRGWV